MAGGVGVVVLPIAGLDGVGDLTGVIALIALIDDEDEEREEDDEERVEGVMNGVGAAELMTGVAVIGEVIGVVEEERVLVVIMGVGVIVEVTWVIGL